MDPHGATIQDQIVGMTIGNYMVRQKLGEGGMGAVYLAEHPTIGKKVALKVLHAEFAADASVVSRFFTEAKAVNDIGHPNIVDIVDYGMITNAQGEQLVYFFMEFLPGHTLTDLIRAESALPVDRALNITIQVADALAASHKCNIVHRDLKPDNIMLAQRGRERDFVKLLDFGIAKLTGDQPGAQKTRAGLVMGTPAYMSPEQCEGRGQIDHRSDIYSLGVVIYEMVTGRVPFYGEGFGEILVQHLTARPVPPCSIKADIPKQVELIVLKCMEKAPEKRFPNMDEMVKALVDPVGYIDAHGGVAGFMATTLVPSDTPANIPLSKLTPSPLAPLTPVPGAMVATTTLGGATGQAVSPPGGKSKTGLFVGLGLAVAAAATVVVVMMMGGGKKTAGASPSPGPGSVTEPGPGTAAGSAKEPGSGSGSGTAAAVDPGSGSGSAADPGSGSGSGTAADPGSRSGSSEVGSGSGSAEPGSGSGSAGPGAGSLAGKKIKIKVSSTPSGAFVYFGDEVKERGKTPIEFEVDAAEGETELLIQRGAKRETRTIKLDADVDLEVQLEGAAAEPATAPVAPTAPVTPATPKKPSTHRTHAAPADPFAPRHH